MRSPSIDPRPAPLPAQGSGAARPSLAKRGPWGRRVACWSTILCGLLSSATFAQAAPNPAAAEYAVHPDLVEAQQEFTRARGGDAYVALARMWDTWGRADPRQGAEGLARAAARQRRL